MLLILYTYCQLLDIFLGPLSFAWASKVAFLGYIILSSKNKNQIFILFKNINFLIHKHSHPKRI